MVHNDEGAYTGADSLTDATAYSDNSIYAEVGLKVGTTHIASLAHQMGITTPLSTNPAMTIGGLKVGVTPLDMAHAYETIAHGGDRVSGSLASDFQPVGIQEVSAGGRTLSDGHHTDRNEVIASSASCRPKWLPPRPRCWRRFCNTAPLAPRRSDGSRPARRARPPTTETPGLWAGTASTRWPCGSATPTAWFR